MEIPIKSGVSCWRTALIKMVSVHVGVNIICNIDVAGGRGLNTVLFSNHICMEGELPFGGGSPLDCNSSSRFFLSYWWPWSICQVSMLHPNVMFSHPILSLFPSFSFPDDPTDLWRKGTPFEAMTGHTTPSSESILAEVFWGFPQL